MIAKKKRDRKLELEKYVRSLIDSLKPRMRGECDLRDEPRLGRTIPALLIPFQEGEPFVANALFVFTKNLSSSGAAVISQTTVESDQIILGLWGNAQCRFAAGKIRYRQMIDGGFWQFGVELTGLVQAEEYQALQKLAGLSDRLDSDES